MKNKFTYDPFQQKAIDYINKEYSVIVSAPTGAGKTAIAEHVIQTCLDEGSKVIYTAPIKALSNQKYRDFQVSAPEKVGILTGDVTINADAPILIMTTEIFRNKILEDRSSLEDYSWIIFDEIHYLDDEQRGSVWEESLIFFPDHMKFLGLSATIPNIKELASWIESIHGQPIKIITEDKRPVPLHIFYQCQGRMYDDYNQLVRKGFKSPHHGIVKRDKLPRFVHLKPNKPADIIKHIAEKDLFPCIYFAFSRKLVESLAQDMEVFDFLDKIEKKEILELYDQLVERYDLNKESSAVELRPLIARGIACHHAGMLPTLKEVVEQLFTKRMLKVIFTTETFALGINMPAKTVIFDELRKFYGTHFGALKTRDFYQMAGRAGRRGIDEEGYVFCRINPHFISPLELYNIINKEPEKVNSQFNASYATLLNLYQSYGEQLYDVYPKSFHHFQVRNFLKKRAVGLMRAKVNVLEQLGHIRDNQLTEKGMFGSKVYGYELMLAEMYKDGLLEKLSWQGLGILIVAVVYEPRKGTSKPKLSKLATEIESVTRKIKKRIHRVEKDEGMKTFSKRCYFHLAPALEAWIQGKSFEYILDFSNVDEGEVVRYFRMSIQVLREITDAPISSELRKRIYKLIDAMNRDVVDSEKQLRS